MASEQKSDEPRSRFSAGIKSIGRAAGKAEAPRVVEAAQGKSAEVATPEPAGPPPSRQGKVAISGYFDPAVRKQLAILAVKEDRSQAALIAEGLNLLFEKYNEPPIAKA